MKPTLLIISIAVFAKVISCQPTSGERKNVAIDSLLEAPVNYVTVNHAEDFDQFYDKFYSDSSFQISRIVFPLKGEDSNIIYGDIQVKDHETEAYFVRDNQLYWKKDGWRFKTTLWEDHEDFFKTIERRDTLVKERIHAKHEFWVLTSHFKLIDGKWMLIFYGNVFN